MDLEADRSRGVRRAIAWIAGGAGIGAVVALVDPKGAPTQGLPVYLLLGALGGLAIWAAWRAVADQGAARSLGAALVTAVALRLGIGIALANALPVLGYDREVQRAGYVFQDAWLRDKDAWDLGRSGRPLTEAFTRPRESDQYGGLLFLSSAIYRYLPGGTHRPLLIVMLAASAGSAAVLFTWGCVSMFFGGKPAMLAAWIVALYPDFVLLGASQMREPFIVAGLALGIFGYARIRAGAIRPGLRQVLWGSLIALVVSPPSALLILVLIGMAWAWEGRLRPSWGMGGLVAIGGLALLLTLAAWSAVTGVGGGNPLALLGSWLSQGADYQLYLLEQGSGWVQKLFDLAPQWAHAPMATLYGLLRPLLPATLADNTGAALWQAIGVWRGLGWFVMLPLLIYSSLAALRMRNRRSLEVYFTVAVWVAAILVSYRAAGDDWDNPRYRAVFIPLMAALVAWGWWHARQVESPWLRRTVVAYLGASLLFLHWFIGRYYHTPRLSLGATFAAMVGFVVLYLSATLLRDGWPGKPGLTVGSPEI